VKRRAQDGLGAEFGGNRIAALLSVGPATRVIEIPRAALPADGRLDYLAGLQLGTYQLDDVMNDDELRKFAPTLDADRIDWWSWARVVAMQTWLYVGNPQAVLRLTDGQIFSVDHGMCFAELVRGGPTGVVVPPLHGVAGTPFDSRCVSAAVEAIESILEDDLIAAMAEIPEDQAWRMPLDRRIRIVDWLLDRQFGVRKVLEPWMPRRD
jgi:hypothetical protein